MTWIWHHVKILLGSSEYDGFGCCDTFSMALRKLCHFKFWPSPFVGMDGFEVAILVFIHNWNGFFESSTTDNVHMYFSVPEIVQCLVQKDIFVKTVTSAAARQHSAKSFQIFAHSTLSFNIFLFLAKMSYFYAWLFYQHHSEKAGDLKCVCVALGEVLGKKNKKC